MSADIYVRDVRNIPKGEHWAIVSTSSVFIPGDERSKTNPGHGYSERTEQYINYEVYFTKEKFEEEFSKRISLVYGASCRGIHVVNTYGSKTIVALEKE